MVGLAKAKRAKEEEEERPRRAYEEALARYGYEAQVRARARTPHGLLFGESFVFEVVAHVNALVDLPNVNELVSTLLVGHADDPVMSLGA